MNIISYAGWERAYHWTNGIIELVATAEVGLRLIRFGLVGEANEFAEYPAHLGRIGGDEWRIVGGHRLWHAPEHRTRTYVPDNAPITADPLPDGGWRLTQPTEPSTGIQKEIDIYMAEDAPSVRVVHRLWNRGMWPVVMAPWALSVMASGGTAVLPLPPRGSHHDHLLPNTSLILWPYTDMGDPRWTWGEEAVLLQQVVGATRPQKIGSACTPGWLAYANRGRLFVKQFAHQPNATYPDGGSSAELFTDGEMLEVETLGPLAEVGVGAAVEHTETWQLLAGVRPFTSAAEAMQAIKASGVV